MIKTFLRFGRVLPGNFTCTVSIMPAKRKASASTKASAKKSKTDEVASESESSSEKDSTKSLLEPCAREPNFKISSWNVSGIRAWQKKNGFDFVKDESPDMIMLQETKCGSKDMSNEIRNLDGYHSYWTESMKNKGYAGVGLYTKTKPIKVTYGLGIAEHDAEGRIITAEYHHFYLVGAYVPNSGRGLVRLEYRQKWNTDFLKYIKDLDSKKPVLYCGDLNVAHEEIDLANPKTNKKSAGFTKEERDDFTTLLNEGFVDSFRALYPKKEKAYSFWCYMGNARGKNVGWRLDYFVVSDRFKVNICDSIIHSDVMGSDHCPISLTISVPK